VQSSMILTKTVVHAVMPPSGPVHSSTPVAFPCSSFEPTPFWSLCHPAAPSRSKPCSPSPANIASAVPSRDEVIRLSSSPPSREEELAAGRLDEDGSTAVVCVSVREGAGELGRCPLLAGIMLELLGR